MPVTGKTGADAIFVALRHICRLLLKYQVKLLALIDTLEADSTITATQKATAIAFVNAAAGACQVFEIIAANSGF